jgi:hypothetical protein
VGEQFRPPLEIEFLDANGRTWLRDADLVLDERKVRSEPIGIGPAESGAA